MLRSSPLSSRGQFGDLLNERGLLGQAVEIGTHRGEFAHYGIMTSWRGERLWCVDPWEVPPGYEPQAELLWGGHPDEPKDHHQAARALLRKHGDRVRLLRMTSAQALQQFGDGSLDFVFVDGDHREEEVLHDLAEWWLKLRPGGILAGHDFIQPGEAHSWAGEVQRALFRFLEWLQITQRPETPGAWWHVPDVHLIVEEGGLPWSFYLEKQ